MTVLKAPGFLDSRASLRSSSLVSLAPVVLTSSGFVEKPGPFHSRPTAIGIDHTPPQPIRSLRSLIPRTRVSRARAAATAAAVGARKRNPTEGRCCAYSCEGFASERSERANRLGRVWLSLAVGGRAGPSSRRNRRAVQPPESPGRPAARAGMKGAGSLDEPRNRKHRTSERSERGGAQRVPRESSDPGAFEAVLSVSVLCSERSGGFRGSFLRGGIGI